MTSQRAVEPPAWGHKTPMRPLVRLWVLLTTEEVLHEDGTTARVTRLRRAVCG
jgi:hypothetical protein